MHLFSAHGSGMSEYTLSNPPWLPCFSTTCGFVVVLYRAHQTGSISGPLYSAVLADTHSGCLPLSGFGSTLTLQTDQLFRLFRDPAMASQSPSQAEICSIKFLFSIFFIYLLFGFNLLFAVQRSITCMPHDGEKPESRALCLPQVSCIMPGLGSSANVYPMS